MPPVSDADLSRMQSLLQNGPIVIGETHTAPHARSAIKKLLDREAVKFLSIELPVGHPLHTRDDGQLDARDDGGQEARISGYFSRVDEMHNAHISLNALARHAMALRVPVYFHDMPHKYSRLRQLNTPASDYVTHAQGFGGPLPRLADGLSDMLPQRNRFTKTFLHHNLGQGVRVLFGLVILAGDHHLLGEKCGGAGNTIQGLLGIADDRVFHCD